MFLKHVTLTSPLSAEEIIRRLRKITETGNGNIEYKSRFEGIVQKNQFFIFPTFDYQSRYRFRPEIDGILKEQENGGTGIQLIFKLSPNVKIFLIAGLILNISVFLYLIIVPSKNELIFNWKVFAVFIPLMLGLLWGDFNYKANRILRLLKHRFRAV